MNSETGSIAAFLYKQCDVPVYESELPEQFQVPSLYILPPSVFDENDTVSTFKKTYSLNVKLFHLDSVQALYTADRIADAVRESRQQIPLLTESGEHTGDFIRITRMETRVGDKGEAVIIISWTSRYYYQKHSTPALRDIDINSGVKQK